MPGVSSDLHAEFARPSEHSPAMLVLSGKATYHEAPDLRRSLLAAISTTGNGHLMVDLSGVEKMDTAAMAVLVEGLMSAQDSSTEVLLCGPTDSVREVFRLAGLRAVLGKCVSCRDEAMRMVQAGKS